MGPPPPPTFAKKGSKNGVSFLTPFWSHFGDPVLTLLDPKEAQRQVAYERQLDLLAAQLDDGEKRLADFNDALDVQRLIERTLNY